MRECASVHKQQSNSESIYSTSFINQPVSTFLLTHTWSWNLYFVLINISLHPCEFQNGTHTQKKFIHLLFADCFTVLIFDSFCWIAVVWQIMQSVTASCVLSSFIFKHILIHVNICLNAAAWLISTLIIFIKTWGLTWTATNFSSAAVQLW